MYRHATLAAASLALALLLPPGGAAAFERTAAPSAGTYQAQVFVQSISGSGCADPSHMVYLGSLSFPGMSASTLTLRALETGIGAALTSIQTLSVKSGKGTTTPAGNFTWSVTGIGGGYNESGTWTSTITEIGSHAFVLQLTEKYGSCTEDLNIPLVRIGANQ